MYIKNESDHKTRKKCYLNQQSKQQNKKKSDHSNKSLPYENEKMVIEKHQ